MPAAIWQAAQEKRKAILERKGQVNRTKHFYLLRDLMYCGFCNAPLGARTKSAKNEHFYYCPMKERSWRDGIEPKVKHSKKAGCGFARSMNIEQADGLVWDVAPRWKQFRYGGVINPAAPAELVSWRACQRRLRLTD